MSAIQKIAPVVVNGIHVQDVHTLVESIAADPAKAATHWRVASAWQGRMHSRSQVDGFSMGGHRVERRFAFDIDEPNQLGGDNGYANPQEHLLGALNACLIAGFTALCALHGYVLESLQVVTEGDIDLRGFLGLDASVSPGYDTLTTTITVKGSASPDEFQEVFERAVATSPNIHNLRRPVKVATSLDVIANQ